MNGATPAIRDESDLEGYEALLQMAMLGRLSLQAV
jgi:hypothetical protein